MTEVTEQKVVIVTAAGRGMGAAIARELAACGWRLALMSLNKAGNVARELGGVGIQGSVPARKASTGWLNSR